MEREAARARAQARRRRAIRLGVGAVAVVLLGLFLASRGGGDSDVETTNSTVPTEVEDPGSAAGKPCVPLADPLPQGAPNVPIRVGPPPTQLVIEDIKVGTGATIAASDTVTVQYIGVSCSSGKIFDSSYSRGGQPATFPLSNVIKGWTDGIPNMKVGGQRLLGIPSAQAYGEAGRPPTIAPDEALWFVVEAVETKPA